MSPALLLAGAMMVALTLYALLGGADYGGGVWDLFAFGPRAKDQRELIAHAIGPIWEANHVWLILVVVLLFAGFPAAFALISTALHVPLALMLIGVVMRGSAFTFRTYDTGSHPLQSLWGRLFAIASLVTPFLLGASLGAISSGEIHAPGSDPQAAYFFSWIAPFPFAVGAFSVVLFALLAAVYLTIDTNDPALREDFRRRAIVSELAAGAMALLVFILAGSGAPRLRGHLAASWWTWPVQIATALCAIAVLWSLWTRRFHIARVCAAGQVTLILWGWGLAQLPYLVEPDITIQSAATSDSTLRLLLIALCAGAALLLPSFYYLFRIFKGKAHVQS